MRQETRYRARLRPAVAVGVVAVWVGLVGVSTAPPTPAAGAGGGTPCERSGPPVFVDQDAGHAHRGPLPWKLPDRRAARVRLDAQLGQARDAALSRPTVADALAGGYRRLTAYLPCIGAHYVHNDRFTDGVFDPAAPEILIYDGTRPDSEIVGLSYSVDGRRAPSGFAGRNDHWHTHSRFCLVDGVVFGNERTSRRECEARGGEVVPFDRVWMLHAWVVPGWESSWGLFSSEHPDLG
jgi:hypothetical protein